jgi:inorganic triphosphatase YgiF
LSGTQEVELKLLLTGDVTPQTVHAALATWADTHGGSLDSFAADTHTDRYFDDPRLSVARAGFGLRLRMGGGRMLATLKSSGAAGGGLHARFELEEPVPEDATAADPWPPRVREVLEGICSVSTLTPLVQLTVERHAAALHVSGIVFEVAFDRVEARQKATKRTVAWNELEVEVKDEAAGAPAAQVLTDLRSDVTSVLQAVPLEQSKLESARERLAQAAAESAQA